MRYKRPYRIKRKKSALRGRFLWLSILTLIVTGAALYFLFLSDFFQIKKIAVAGQGASLEDIEFLIPKTNIFFFNTQKIEQVIVSSFPAVAKAKINRTLPDSLAIVITERKAAAVWCENGKCFLTDNKGTLFGESQENDLIKISGGKELLNQEKIDRLLGISSTLKNKLEINIQEASLISEERLNLKTAEGWQIYFNLKGDLDWQIQELGLVLEKQIPAEKRTGLEYVDLRFSRVYYKYKR